MPPKKGPQHPCGTCFKSAKHNSLLCNFCNMWHHATIDCIPWHTKETIDALLDICKDQSCWTCQKCTGIMKKLNGRLAKLEKDVSEVQSTVDDLSTKQESTEKTVSTLRQDFDSFKQTVTNDSAAEKVDVLTEMKDREDRKHNVIVNGLKESSATEKDAVHAEENALLDKVFTDMQMDATTTSTNIHFKTRLGAKQPGKQRPYLLKFRDQRTRDDVLRNAKKVLASGVRIKPDLTKIQREEDAKFKKTIDEENNAKPEDESGEYRWKVAGPPGNLRKLKVRNVQEWEEEARRRREEREGRE